MSWFKAGNKATINGAVVTHNTYGNQTSYGIQEVSKGKHEWKIKVHNGNAIFIGIASNTNDLNNDIYGKEGTYALSG